MSTISPRLKQNKEGFTLIEILVVVAIIALLMSIVIGISGSVNEKAAETAAKAELLAIQQLIEEFRTDEGHYPESGGNGALLAEFFNWYEEKYKHAMDDVATVDWNNNEILDPWGNDYRYHFDKDESKHVYVIGSYGPNGKCGENGGSFSPPKSGGASSFGAYDDITNFNGKLN